MHKKYIVVSIILVLSAVISIIRLKFIGLKADSFYFVDIGLVIVGLSYYLIGRHSKLPNRPLTISLWTMLFLAVGTQILSFLPVTIVKSGPLAPALAWVLLFTFPVLAVVSIVWVVTYVVGMLRYFLKKST